MDVYQAMLLAQLEYEERIRERRELLCGWPRRRRRSLRSGGGGPVCGVVWAPSPTLLPACWCGSPVDGASADALTASISGLHWSWSCTAYSSNRILTGGGPATLTNLILPHRARAGLAMPHPCLDYSGFDDVRIGGVTFHFRDPDGNLANFYSSVSRT
jgi:hypothetical protein